MSLKYYSDWKLGKIQIDLTPLTLRITEDSAKQLVNSLQLTVICMIRLTKENGMYLMFGLHIPRLFPFAKSKGTFREYDILKTRRGAVRDKNYFLC